MHAELQYLVWVTALDSAQPVAGADVAVYSCQRKLLWRGKTDASGSRVAENPVSVPAFNATIAHAMGMPLETVIMSPSGRPFTVGDKAPPLTKIFA